MRLMHRILLAPLLAVAFLAASGGVSQWSIQALRGHFETLQNQQLKTAHTLGSLQTRMASMNTLLYRTMTLAESLDAPALTEVKRKIKAETEALSTALTALAPEVGAESQAQIKSVIEQIGKYQSNAQQALTFASSDGAMAVMVLASAEKSFNASFSSLTTVAQAVDADAATMGQQVVGISARSLWLIVSLTVFAMAASLALAWHSARSIVTRLDGAVKVSESVARGELDVDVPAAQNDEVGRLLLSLRGTVDRLGASLRDIQQASGSIHTASSEIACGSLDLSGRTEQAASNLQQTAATMEQLTDTVRHSADAARQANSLAASATEVAARGGEVFSEVVSTMDAINESSKKIADIIGVIDGIAFQTNILALNAAVEAARAGEQGRGFAVVASEVRSLAQRSAEAAKQIKGLIGNSVDKVGMGARLVQDAGQTMNEIVGSVRRVSDIIGEITAATLEQSNSIAEVNKAVSMLDQMTQQNAALVEQSAAASESLKEQATRMSSAVGAFRLRA